MKFFLFRQNNSGGMFEGPHFVFIEAETPEQANEMAIYNGVYFGGVCAGIDCECCGDRWIPVSQYDAVESLEEIMRELPSVASLSRDDSYKIAFSDGRTLEGGAKELK